jgi:WD40 repeat protein
VSDIVLRATATSEIVATMEGLCRHPDVFDIAAWPEDCRPLLDPGSAERTPDRPFGDWVRDLAFTADGSLLAMGGLETDGVVVWDAKRGEIIALPTVTHKERGPNSVLDVEFSSDGSRLAASFVWAPKELWLISTDTWEASASYVAPPGSQTGEAPSDNLTFTPDGAMLIATDYSSFGSGRIVFMDATTLETVGVIPDAHRVGVTGLALSADGVLLASAGLDGVVRLWDVASRSLLQEIPTSRAGDGLGGVAFASDQRHLLVTAMASGELRVVTTDVGELLDIARERVTRTFTATECQTYGIDPCPTLEDIRSG